MSNSYRASIVRLSVARGRACSVGLALALAGLPSWCARAETAVLPPTQLPTPVGSPPALGQRLLMIEPSFWGTFGIILSRSGQRVGPTFFSTIPEETVRGSSEGRRHAGHARVWQGFVIGFGVAGLGLIGAGLAERDSANEWNAGAKVLVASGVLGLIVESAAALARQNEIAAAVSSYNEDLVTGTLAE